MKYLIIPSSKYAPEELSSYGKIPMVLYPVNNGTILDLILKQYDSSYKIVVVAYEGYKKIVDAAKTIKSHNLEVFKLDELKDLQYSIYKAFENIGVTNEDNVVINFGDTIVKNSLSLGDIIVSQRVKTDELDPKWSYLKHENGRIVDIVDKYDLEKRVGLSDYHMVCGVFSIASPLDFLEIMRKSINNSKSFFQSIQDYSINHHFLFEEAIEWLDLGHDTEFFDSDLAIKSRVFNHIQIDKNRGILTKKSTYHQKFKYEISWYINLPKELSYVTPRIFDYSLEDNNLFVKMEYYSYATLLELFLYGNLNDADWRKVFSKIRFVLDDFYRFSYKDKRIKDSLREMYYSKTIERLNSIKTDKRFEPFFINQVVINGTKYISLQEILDSLGTWVNDILLNIDTFCVIHGDLCFANILIDNKFNFLKLIDPRGVFGEHSIYGDGRYDLAKLFHSVDGKYDHIIKDLFDIDVLNNRINVNFYNKSDKIYTLLKDSLRSLPNYSVVEIEFIEALLFLSMIPLHSENINHQYAMLAVAYQILSRHFNIEVKE